MANKDRNKRSARKARAQKRAEREAAQAASAVSNPKQTGGPAKRAAVVAKASEKQDKPAKASNKKPGLGTRTKNYLGAVRTEMRRVVWPSREELRNYSVAVIVSLVVFGVVLWLVDTGIVAALVGYTSLGA